MSTDGDRPTSALREIGSAASEVFLALGCLAGLLHAGFAERLAADVRLALGLEFVALHAFGFLGVIALAKPATPARRRLRIPAFIAVGIIYSLAIGTRGWGAVVSFWLLMLSTYAGFLLHDQPDDRRRSLFLRWGVATATFLAAAVVSVIAAEAFNLKTPQREFLLGLCFFGSLAAFEVMHLYDRVLAWARRPAARNV